MKEKILELLKNKKDFISGQELCERFDVSRTAVWKAINNLKSKGYEIESVTNKGYRLVSSPDIISQSEINSYLDTDFIGRELITLDSVDSTNNHLKAIAHNCSNGTVVTAREQTGGKGRLGRVWQCEKDSSLYFSLFLKPEISPMEVSAITPLCGLSVAKGLNEYFDFDAKIKWPNDVIIGSKKVCGILTEMSCEFDRVDYIIVGIGINLLQKSFPPEIAKKATSCQMESKMEIDKNKLLALILKNIENILVSGDYCFNKSNLEEYKKICATLGRKITYKRNNSNVTAVATDINHQGELIVTLSDGTKDTVFSGEVTVQGIY